MRSRVWLRPWHIVYSGDEGVVCFVCSVVLDDAGGFGFVFGEEVVVGKVCEDLEHLVVVKDAWEQTAVADAM